MAKRIRKRRASTARTTELPSGRHAVAAVDPGMTTGLFAGVVELEPMMKATVATLERVRFDQVGDGKEFLGDATLITVYIQDWFASAALDYVAPVNHHVVFENWDTGRVKVGRELASVWVMAAAAALLTAGRNAPFKPEQIRYQTAGMAKGYATNDRLKLWNLWDLTKGQPHARDASRHWATYVNELVG